MKFKVGDKVRRIIGEYEGMRVGDIATIKDIIEDVIYLKEYSFGHSIENFKPIGYKPKTPTHLVIWEEDRDPVSFFTSEKEAKDFIKKLSDRSDVKKDSVILVEIKSCKKIQINKVLRYNPHKI